MSTTKRQGYAYDIWTQRQIDTGGNIFIFIFLL